MLGPRLVFLGVLFGGIGLFFGMLSLSRMVKYPVFVEASSNTQVDNPVPVSQEAQSGRKMSPKNSDCSLSAYFPASILQWCGEITEQAYQNGLEPNLVAAIIWLESRGEALARSSSGAVGLMQVMPRDGIAQSFQCINGPCFADRPTIAELEEPAFNIAYGTRLLKGLLGRYGNLREALKAYGPVGMGYRYADMVLGAYRDAKGN